MAFVNIENTRVRDTGSPGGEHFTAIAAAEGEMAFGHSQKFPAASNLGTHFTDTVVGRFPGIHKMPPGFFRIGAVLIRSQRRILQAGIEMMMERNILEMFTGFLYHARSPAAVAPGQQLNRRVFFAHRFGKGNRMMNGRVTIEAIFTLLSIGRFIPQLPEFDIIGSFGPMPAAVWIVGIIAIIYPFRGFAGRAGTQAAPGIFFPGDFTVTFKIDTDQWFRVGLLAEIDEFVRADLIGFNTIPALVKYRHAFCARTDRFTPAVI